MSLTLKCVTLWVQICVDMTGTPFDQLLMIGTRNTALIPTHNTKIFYRVNLPVLLNYICRITCRIASRYFTLPEVTQLRYPRFPACNLLLIPHHRCSRD